MISKRLQQLQPSPTLSLDSKVKQLQSQGQQIINLGLGEPDFTTPPHICKAAITAIHEGFTHYTITAGILPLREAICKKLDEDNAIHYVPSEVVVGVGTKQLLYHAFQALCNGGDEVIVPLPTWSTYIEQIKLSGATPVLIPLKPPFKVTVEDIAKKITKKTKVLLLNSPGNPTGAMIDKKQLMAIAQLAIDKGIYVVSDEIYEKITYGKKHVSIASLGKKIKELTITINGFSKSYAMTGWRIGYAAGPQEVIQAMISLQTQTTSGTSSISQKAGVTALISSQRSIETMKNEFEKRRDYLVTHLSQIPELSFNSPEGAFYLFINIHKLLKGRFTSSQEWCQKLLEEEQVSVVPGEAFLYPGYFRLSFATSLKNLQNGVKKITNFINRPL